MPKTLPPSRAVVTKSRNPLGLSRPVAGLIYLLLDKMRYVLCIYSNLHEKVKFFLCKPRKLMGRGDISHLILNLGTR